MKALQVICFSLFLVVILSSKTNAESNSDFKIVFLNVKEEVLIKVPLSINFKVIYSGKSTIDVFVLTTKYIDDKPFGESMGEGFRFDGKLMKEYENRIVFKAEQIGTYKNVVSIYSEAEIEKKLGKRWYIDDLIKERNEIKPIIYVATREIRAIPPKNESEEFESALADLADTMDNYHAFENKYPQSIKEVEGHNGYTKPKNMEFSIVQFKDKDKNCIKIKAKNTKTGNESREFQICNRIR